MNPNLPLAPISDYGNCGGDYGDSTFNLNGVWTTQAGQNFTSAHSAFHSSLKS